MANQLCNTGTVLLLIYSPCRTHGSSADEDADFNLHSFSTSVLALHLVCTHHV